MRNVKTAQPVMCHAVPTTFTDCREQNCAFALIFAGQELTWKRWYCSLPALYYMAIPIASKPCGVLGELRRKICRGASLPRPLPDNGTHAGGASSRPHGFESGLPIAQATVFNQPTYKTVVVGFLGCQLFLVLFT